MRFYLGTDHPDWLAKTNIPLFVSARRLRVRARKKIPRAVGPWALDSGGFSEVSLFGGWQTPATQYGSEARAWQQAVGLMDFCAIQDWMCEPPVLAGVALAEGVFGAAWKARYFAEPPARRLAFAARQCPRLPSDLLARRIAEHQRRTVHSWKLLRQLAPDLPWLPVLQGWAIEDYLRHVEDYAAAGTDLRTLPLVGLGSVCRRQDTSTAEDLIAKLSGMGIRLHGFGFKLDGLRRAHAGLASADSMAWSYAARHGRPLPGCPHKKCNHCLRYALRWRDKVLRACQSPTQAVFEWSA